MRTFVGKPTLTVSGDEYEEKAAQWFELFFDLVLVTACSSIADGFKEDLSGDGLYTFLTELPTYMATVLHFNIKSNAIISALPYLLMFIVSVLSTQAADFILAQGYDRTYVRKLFNSLAIYLPALFIVLAGYSGCDYMLTIALLCLAVGSNGCHYAGFMCVHIDMASNYAGTLLGITNCAANFSTDSSTHNATNCSSNARQWMHNDFERI